MLIRQGNINEVIYEGTVKGEGLAICLSQNDQSTSVTWLLTVYVKTLQGWWMLGFITTNTPTIDGATERVVGFASCPGAVGWKVVAQNAAVVGNVTLDAELVLVPGLCCGGGSPYGVFIPPPPGEGRFPVDNGGGGGG
jgi:hypothetical protein